MSTLAPYRPGLIASVILSIVSSPTIALAQPAKPNILWLSYEDSSPHLGCYGDKQATTPNIDRFATQAARYTHVFTNAGVCAPSRSGIITGCYPNTIGSGHMRSSAKLPAAIKPFPTYLREAGYYCTNNVKEDYNFAKPAGTWDESSNKAHYRNRKPGQPFFAVFNFTQSHESQFHGDGLPRCKRWLYDSGTRVPLLVRIPEKFRTAGQGKGGAVSDELLNGPDFGMTVLNLAGVKLPAAAQGRAFLGANLSPPREYVFGARDRMDERYDIIRTARDKRYRYIRNYEPWKPYDQVIGYCEKGAVMQELRRVEAEGMLPEAAKLFMGERKPREELYDTDADPWEIRNLAALPEHQETLKRLRGALEKWQEETLDLGFLPEPILTEQANKAGSHYEILRKAGTGGGAGLVRKLREAATLYESGDTAIPQLVKLQSDEHPAIRYWAITGLTQLSLAPESKVDLEKVLRTALEDDEPVVRIAGARALWLHKRTGAAVNNLIEDLADKNDWNRLAALLVLDEMGEDARPALPAIRKAAEEKHEYVNRMTTRILANLKAQ